MLGKDTIFKKLKEKINVKPYVMYTTRPKRTGEINGVDYNYLSDAEMNGYLTLQSNMLIESRTYDTVYGKWTYATILDNQFNPNKDLLMTGTLESYIHIKEFFEENEAVELIPIYIEVEDGLRLERALKREREQKEPKYISPVLCLIILTVDLIIASHPRLTHPVFPHKKMLIAILLAFCFHLYQLFDNTSALLQGPSKNKSAFLPSDKALVKTTNLSAALFAFHISVIV